MTDRLPAPSNQKPVVLQEGRDFATLAKLNARARGREAPSPLRPAPPAPAPSSGRPEATKPPVGPK